MLPSVPPAPHQPQRIRKKQTLNTADRRNKQDSIFSSTVPTRPGISPALGYKMQGGRCVPKRFTSYNKTLVSDERQIKAKHKSNFFPSESLGGRGKTPKKIAFQIKDASAVRTHSCFFPRSDPPQPQRCKGPGSAFPLGGGGLRGCEGLRGGVRDGVTPGVAARQGPGIRTQHMQPLHAWSCSQRPFLGLLSLTVSSTRPPSEPGLFTTTPMSTF